MKDQLYSTLNNFNGIYRGFVVWNNDPKVRGRIKIFVPGVYSEYYKDKPRLLPWACPAMPPFCGNAPNNITTDNPLLNSQTGWSSTPHAGNIKTGSQVFVFFENGDINYPIYFAFAQPGETWLAEHPNQHVFKSDNIRIRIDENVKDKRSTCKFNSYSTNMSTIAKDQLKKDCKQFNWEFDENGGNIKQLETRIDIEIEASKPEVINAVNLNIHGNVNLHIDGDWFVEHIGNKYEYHEGDTYVRHKGNYHILHDGTSITDLTGDKTFIHKGNSKQIHTGDTDIHHYGEYKLFVEKDAHVQYHSNYELEIGGYYSENVGYFGGGNKDIIINGNKDEKVFGNSNLSVMESFHITVDNSLDANVVNDILCLSQEGNINLKTAGNFELLKNGQMSGKGYQNLGAKGNIQLISTFGNINLQCIEDISKADFHQKTIVMPWNPGFLAKISSLALINPMFASFFKESVLLQGEGFLKDLDDLSEIGIDSVVKLISSFKTLVLYDGLPVFLPTKMIVQNPNTPSPMSVDDLSWIPVFRNEPDDWRTITDDIQWKLPGRCMGNINIETWSGDINIKTDSQLGCAGNISILAKENAGTLPGYKIGTIDIKSEANKRIYPDPRDLFFDSDFDARLQGKIKMFSHGASSKDATMIRKSVLPPALNSILQTFLQGMGEITCEHLGYDKFYDIYGLNIATNGNLSNMSPIVLSKMADLKNMPEPKLGCIKCISDYLLGLPGVQDLCYVTEKYENFGVGGLHDYCFSTYSPFVKTKMGDDYHSARGVFNVESALYESLSIGDGHAIEMGFCDRELTGPNMGGINISCGGDFNKFIDRNEHKTVNQTIPEGKVTINNTHTEFYYDEKFPPVLLTVDKAMATVWNTVIPPFVKVDNGNFDLGALGISVVNVILNLSGLNAEFPENKFRLFGYENISENLVGDLIINKNTSYRYHGFDLGVTLKTCFDIAQNPGSALSKLKFEVSNDYWDQHIVNYDEKIDSKIGENRVLLFKFEDPFPFSIDLNVYGDKTRHFQTFLNTKNSTKKFHFYWDKNKINSGLALPELEITEHAINTDEIGNKNIDTKKVDFDISSDLAPFKIMEHPDTTYVLKSQEYTDYIKYEWKGPFNPGSFAMDVVLKLSQTKYLDVDEVQTNDVSSKTYARRINENITYISPINHKELTLDSNTYWIDWQQKQRPSMNTINIVFKGNDEAINNIPNTSDNTHLMDELAFPYMITTRNLFKYSANKFTYNDFIINNANETLSGGNQVIINNGYITSMDSMAGMELPNTNVIKFNNGYDEMMSQNYYVINNGGDTVDPLKSNVNKLEINNGWGKTSYVMTAGAGTYDITEYSHLTKNTTTGDTEIRNVPNYNINTMNITFTNSQMYTINTLNYTNVTTVNIDITCTNYNLKNNIYSESSVGAYSVTVGANLSMVAGGTGTFSAAGVVNVGSSNPSTQTNITGRFFSVGFLSGNVIWAMSAGCAPLGGSSPANISAGLGNATGSPTAISPQPPMDPIIIETPMHKFALSKILLGYLNIQYEYIKSLFKKGSLLSNITDLLNK